MEARTQVFDRIRIAESCSALAVIARVADEDAARDEYRAVRAGHTTAPAGSTRDDDSILRASCRGVKRPLRKTVAPHPPIEITARRSNRERSVGAGRYPHSWVGVATGSDGKVVHLERCPRHRLALWVHDRAGYAGHDHPLDWHHDHRGYPACSQREVARAASATGRRGLHGHVAPPLLFFREAEPSGRIGLCPAHAHRSTGAVGITRPPDQDGPGYGCARLIDHSYRSTRRICSSAADERQRRRQGKICGGATKAHRGSGYPLRSAERGTSCAVKAHERRGGRVEARHSSVGLPLG
jgi:hypothetical protein